MMKQILHAESGQLAADVKSEWFVWREQPLLAGRARKEKEKRQEKWESHDI